jgi:glycosyltransferase involved in cell wall biosynthesis
MLPALARYAIVTPSSRVRISEGDMAVRLKEQASAAAAKLARPPGVMQVLPSLVTGGVERGTIDVAAALTAAGWNALVVSAGGPLVREVERAGAAHVQLPVDSKNPLVMRANVARLARLARERKIDFVHARSRAPAWSARAAAKRVGAHFITTFHGTYNAQNPLKKLYNSIMAKGERVIAISDFIGAHAREVYGADPAAVRVIPRGIDLALFDRGAVSQERMIRLAQAWHLPDGMPVVMLPGRLTEWKGQSVLIDAMAKLEHQRQDVHCILVGDDQGRSAYRRRLAAQIERLDLGGVVQIVGACNDMPAAYMLADVVVSASTDPEAFGRVAVEAQALGRLVVATDHGASRETVIDGVTGWLVAAGDPAALAEGLRMALAVPPQSREQMSRRAMAHVRENFGKERMCAATLALYKELLGA